LSAQTTVTLELRLPGQCVITHEIAVAEGVFAPGHLGELTQIVPFEMVDAALAECGATQRRRKLPARVVVYLLLAATLFEECGYPAVWARLTAALGSLPPPAITATGLWHARTRLGAGPLRALFDLLRGPAAAIRTAGARWAGLLVVAIDGTCLDVPDDPATRARLGKGSNQYTAASGYPQILLVALVACGTRAVIDAVFGPRSGGEIAHGQRLARSLRSGMIVLLDRGFASGAFLETVAGTGAELLARKPPVLRRLPDGSFLSRLGTLQVRIIECEITIATTAGRHTGSYRLATTLLDPCRHTAFELVKLYHQRWEVESAYFALKKTMLGRRVLRARTLPGIAKEIYALLTAYQAIRIAISDAILTSRCRPRPGQLQHRPPSGPRPGHSGCERDRRRSHRPRRRHRPPHPGQPATRPPAARQPPSRQTNAVPLRLQEPARRPAHLQGNDQHRHLDNLTQPLTSWPWAKAEKRSRCAH
jgi:Insertion element 4 transposase N-terminal/Transposase DDE domain